MARAAYLTLFFANAVAAALLREFGQQFLARFSSALGFFSECATHDAGAYCVGNQLVYRMSFSMSCFFLFTMLLSCAVARGCENACCLTLVHIPFYFAMLVASLFLPNAFFDDYADVARVASAAFMILQIVIILDYAYNLRDHIVDKMDEAERDEDARQALLDTTDDSASSSSVHTKTLWEAVYLAIVLALTLASTIAVVVLFQRLAGCDLNVAFLSITTLSCVMLTVLSATSWVNAGLLPAAAFTAYTVFLCYQAVHSNPDPTCSSVDPSTIQHQTKSVALNAALAAFTITWTSWRTSTTKTNLFTLSSPASENKEGAEAEDRVESGRSARSLGKGDVVVPEYQFHALMFLATFYMAMVITNWGSANGRVSEDDELVSMWVKISSQWVAIGLFLWTLIAPSVFPDRDFGI